MKAVMIIYDQELQHELDFILRANEIEHYSLVEGIKGSGTSGLKRGDAVGPGLNNLYWIVLDDEKAKNLLKELNEFKFKKLKKKGVQAFVLSVESAI